MSEVRYFDALLQTLFGSFHDRPDQCTQKRISSHSCCFQIDILVLYNQTSLSGCFRLSRGRSLADLHVARC